jgi:hypothetical protein
MLNFVIEETLAALIRDCVGREQAVAVIAQLEQESDGVRGMDTLVDEVQDSILRSVERHPWGTSLMTRREVEEAALVNYMNAFRECIPLLAQTANLEVGVA